MLLTKLTFFQATLEGSSLNNTPVKAVSHWSLFTPIDQFQKLQFQGLNYKLLTFKAKIKLFLWYFLLK